MSGQTVAAFVGKLLPLGLLEKKVHGLFLSLSPLTPEAEDYFRTVENMGLTTKVGKELYNQITATLHLPTEASLHRKLKVMTLWPQTFSRLIRGCISYLF